MKKIKKILAAALLFVIAGTLLWSKASALEPVKMIAVGVNDRMAAFPDAKPYIKGSTAYVPIRFLGEAFGGNVTYDAKTNSVIYQNKEQKMIFDIRGQKIIYGQKIISCKIFDQNGRTYAELRLMGETLGYKVDYLSKHRVVRLYNSEPHLSHPGFISQWGSRIHDYIYSKGPVVVPPSKPASQKTVYLTFDDGPSKFTSELIAILNHNDIHATFFQIGQNVKEYPSAAKKVADNGNYIGIHTYTHDASKLYHGTAGFMNEVSMTQKLIKQTTGVATSLVRAPYGSKPYLTQAYRDQLAAGHYKLWDWDIDTRDWEVRDRSDLVLNNVKSGVVSIQHRSTKEPMVILMHEKSVTVSILQKVIDYLKTQGYTFEKYDPAHHIVKNFWNDKRL
ncbi:polysaccharide deacetylase family protein [Falsibacillus albus]|uniref:NodB homology domain-containing protein n=1 Tax=Falsibacillus albus TaxID=2478915 RepID=A0A3L7JWS9_9BACI|nr:polysaccharide deacetylase family protein [Falsibacillus albus]RLQ94775.1 hypothetical protein D9X91_12330 [Falsibacillus albus]